jgi:hypothetical protein
MALYAVLSQKEKQSKYGGTIIEITMVDIVERTEWITYIDYRNHNHSHWQHITNNPNHGFVLKNLKRKRHKDKNLINADSKPVINEEFEDPNEMFDLIKQLWDKEDRKKNPNRFWEMFE